MNSEEIRRVISKRENIEVAEDIIDFIYDSIYNKLSSKHITDKYVFTNDDYSVTLKRVKNDWFTDSGIYLENSNYSVSIWKEYNGETKHFAPQSTFRIFLIKGDADMKYVFTEMNGDDMNSILKEISGVIKNVVNKSIEKLIDERKMFNTVRARVKF